MKFWTTLLLLTWVNSIFSQVDSTSLNNANKSKPTVKINLNPTPPIDYVTPPVGFDTSGYFNGYVDLSRHSAIIIQELQKINPKQGRQAFEQKMDYFSQNGMTVNELKDFVATNGSPGFYMKISYLSKEVKYTRYLVYIGKNSSLFLDVVFPESEGLDAEMIKCFESVTYNL